MRVRLHVATGLLLLLLFTLIAFAQPSSQAGAAMSDRDKAGLRGPVKTVVEEQTFIQPDGHAIVSTNVTEYTTDGKILQRRHENPDGSAWVTTYTYADDGRLLKTSSGNSGSPTSEQSYSYDETKQLIGTKFGDREEIRYQYDESGLKTTTERYSQEPLPPNVGYASQWEGTDLGFAPLPGGKFVTSYNEQGVATGAKLYDSQGKLVGHIVRQFDAQGHIVAEQQVTDAPESMVPEELRSQLNPEQMKGMGQFIAGGMTDRSVTYSYDSQGRVSEVRKGGGVFGEQVTATTYNKQGDVATETSTSAMNPVVGQEYGLTETGAMVPTGNPQPAAAPSTFEIRYNYEYDSRGNWTERTMLSRSDPHAPFTPSTTLRRKLTYY